ncbi:MAG: hypothetical protein V4552_06260 [Pseudomonadota bacterium]
MLLSGCLGGSIAQQIARSIATSVADNAVATAMDVQESDVQDRFGQNKKYSPENNPIISQNTTQQNLALQSLAVPNTAQQNSLLQKNTQSTEAPLDPYKLAFVNARFDELKPIAEPLPEQLTEVETPIAVVQSNQLVPVELFNLLIGEEKAAVYTKAQLLGSSSLPKQREWKLWRVATGVIKTSVIKSENTNKAVLNSQTDSAQSKQIITFLIPPEFGKLPSGSIALVEIASPGELNIARYKIN